MCTPGRLERGILANPSQCLTTVPMSLIHEALKKAEAQRQLGAIPTLGSPVSMTRRRRAWLAPLLSLLAAVVAAGGVWLWVSGSVTTHPESRDAEQIAARATPDAEKQVSAGQPATSTPSTVATNSPSGPRRTQSLQADAGESFLPKPTQARTATTPQSRRSHPMSPPTATPRGGNMTSASEHMAPPQAPHAAIPTPTPLPVAAPPAAPIVDPAAHDDGLPLYWELPYAERKDLPEFRISMHVFAADPADRFVILNGTRQKEGDTLPGDLKLVRIDPDGIVLEHKGKQFRVPRGGGY